VMTYFQLQPVRVEWISAILGLDEKRVRFALVNLTGRPLAADTLSDTYTLPARAADFLRDKRSDIVAKSGDGMARYASTLAVNNGFDKYESFPTLDSNWPVIAAAIPLLAGRGIAELATVAEALRVYLGFSGRWVDDLLLEERTEQTAIDSGDFYRAGWSAYRMGWVYWLQRKPSDLEGCATRSESYWQRSEKAGKRERALVMRLRGLSLELQRKWAKALAAYEEALKLLPDSAVTSRDVRKEIAEVLNDIGDARRELGEDQAAERHDRAAERNYREAERNYKKAFVIWEELRDREGLVIGKEKLAWLALLGKKWLEAEQLAQEALDSAIPRQELTGRLHLHLAEALVGQGRAESAESHARAAVNIFEQLGQPDYLKRARMALDRCAVR